MRNHRGYSGFRLNKPQYSAHHYEQDYLLMDGTYFFVLKVEEMVLAQKVPGLEELEQQ